MGQATMELPTYAGILEKRLLEYHITPWQYIQILLRYSVHMGSGDATVGINPPKSQRLASSSPPPRLSPALSLPLFVPPYQCPSLLVVVIASIILPGPTHYNTQSRYRMDESRQ